MEESIFEIMEQNRIVDKVLVAPIGSDGGG